MRPQPLICVTDVEQSIRWYQALFGCESGHGGDGVGHVAGLRSTQ
jgi:hypothetical protein